MRIEVMKKADKHSKEGLPPSNELLEDLGRFIDEVANAGVLYATDKLKPSAKSARVQLSELF
jgi:hypothetical protein